MESKRYLTFDLDGLHYAVETAAVREIVSLLELNPVEQAPSHIVGVFNLRGKLVPVLDLSSRFGHPPKRYHLTDHVILIEDESRLMGIIVSQANDEVSISSGQIEVELTYGAENRVGSRFGEGFAKVDQNILMLLNHRAILQSTAPLGELIQDERNALEASGEAHPAGAENGSNVYVTPTRVFFPEATPGERAELRDRALKLMEPLEDEDTGRLTPMAIIRLSGEYFAVDVDTIREFTGLLKVTPVPCSPKHIVGTTNLRGDVLTLVDIRGALELTAPDSGDEVQVVVVESDGSKAGILVDEVANVSYVSQENVTTVPAAASLGSAEFVKGTAPYEEKMLTVLDLPKLLKEGDLIVDEEV